MKFPRLRRSEKQKGVKVSLPPIDRHKLVAAYAKYKLGQKVVPLRVELEVPELPFDFSLPPVSPPKQVRPVVTVPIAPPMANYRLNVGRILATISGTRRPGEDAIVDVTDSVRLFVLGTSGAGKTNLCKVLIEEYFKNTPLQIFVFDTESEYIMMGRPQEDESLVSSLEKFSLEPQAFPVRAISLPSILRDDIVKGMLREYNVEAVDLRLDPRMIDSDLLQLWIGPNPTNRTYCDVIANTYRQMGEYTYESLVQAVEASGVPTQFKKKLLLTLEIYRPMIQPFDVKRLLATRKINVFLFPSEIVTSASERVTWAVFFSSFVHNLHLIAEVTSLAVMDEAAEFARGEFTERMVKSKVAGLYRRGRKRGIDSVIASNIGGVLEDIKANITGAFYFRMPETAFSRSMKAKATVRPELEDYVTRLKNYQAVMDLPAANETYIIQVRPAQSYLPPKKKRREEEGRGEIVLI